MRKRINSKCCLKKLHVYHVSPLHCQWKINSSSLCWNFYNNVRRLNPLLDLSDWLSFQIISIFFLRGRLQITVGSCMPFTQRIVCTRDDPGWILYNLLIILPLTHPRRACGSKIHSECYFLHIFPWTVHNLQSLRRNGARQRLTVRWWGLFSEIIIIQFSVLWRFNIPLSLMLSRHSSHPNTMG